SRPNRRNRAESGVALSECIFVGPDPGKDFVKAAIEIDRRLPVKFLGAFAIVGEVNRQVALASGMFYGDICGVSEVVCEQLRSFAQGKRIRGTAAKIENLATEAADLSHLKLDQRQNIVKKQNVAHLLAVPADIFECELEVMRDGPPHHP